MYICIVYPKCQEVLDFPALLPDLMVLHREHEYVWGESRSTEDTRVCQWKERKEQVLEEKYVVKED